MSTFFPVSAKPIQLEVILPDEPLLNVPGTLGTVSQDIISSGSGMVEVIVPRILCAGTPSTNGTISLVALHAFNLVRHHTLYTANWSASPYVIFSATSYEAAAAMNTNGLIYRLNPGMLLRLIVTTTGSPGTGGTVTTFFSATKWITAS